MPGLRGPVVVGPLADFPPAQWTVDAHGALTIDLTGTVADAVTGITIAAPSQYDSIPSLLQLQSQDGSVKTYLMHDLDIVVQSSTSGTFKLVIDTGGHISANVLSLYDGDVTGGVLKFDMNGVTNQAGFFGAPAASQPVVPLTGPTVQNVINALVTLGLVAQHD